MKKLSEYKDDEALELLADLVVPALAIFQDEEVQSVYKEETEKETEEKESDKKDNDNQKLAKAISIALRKHKKEVVEILAILDGVPVEKYHVNVLSLPVKLTQIMGDTELLSFFASQSQNTEKESSGSAMENTKEKA